jgi:DNA gyrase subunit B
MELEMKNTDITDYSIDKIQVLEGLQAVRKRPSMYIGSTDERGLHHLVYEVLDNSIDEAMAGFCSNIEITLEKDNVVTVSDDGRGIPVEKHPKFGISGVELVMTKLHAGGKFDQQTYKVSGGLHGVGVSVVNALSEWLEVEVHRNDLKYQQRYQRGTQDSPLEKIGKTEKTGTIVRFRPDTEIFGDTELHFETIFKRIRELAYLNRGLRITILDKVNDRQESFKFDGGIVEFVEFINHGKNVLHEQPIYLEAERETVIVEISIQYNDSYLENTIPLANKIQTKDSGTHLCE